MMKIGFYQLAPVRWYLKANSLHIEKMSLYYFCFRKDYEQLRKPTFWTESNSEGLREAFKDTDQYYARCLSRADTALPVSLLLKNITIEQKRSFCISFSNDSRCRFVLYYCRTNHQEIERDVIVACKQTNDAQSKYRDLVNSFETGHQAPIFSTVRNFNGWACGPFLKLPKTFLVTWILLHLPQEQISSFENWQ